jgi:hypothetical protein
MDLRGARRFLGILLALISATVFIWGTWPFRRVVQSIPLDESRRLSISWPVVIRVGDAQKVQLILEPREDARSAVAGQTASILDPLEQGFATETVQAYHILAESRLEVAGLPLIPGDLVSQPVLPGGRVVFSWSAYPQRAGTYPGVIWLYLRLIPLASGDETTRPVLAREFQIRAVELFGLGGPPARLLGISGILLATAIGLDGWYIRMGRLVSRVGR